MAKRTIHRERVRVTVEHVRIKPEPVEKEGVGSTPLWLLLAAFLVFGVVVIGVVDYDIVQLLSSVRPELGGQQPVGLGPSKTPRPSRTPRPTITPLPKPRELDTGNPAVSVKLSNKPSLGSEGLLTVKFLLYDLPLGDWVAGYKVVLYVGRLREKDIAGKWVVDWDWRLRPDDKGIMFTKLDPGKYVLRESTSTHWEWSYIIRGGWHTHRDPEGIVFPIEAGVETRVSVVLSKLEVGIINQERKAGKGRTVWIYEISHDVAGNRLLVNEETRRTDDRGIATFYLGPGKYVLEAIDSWHGLSTPHAQVEVKVEPKDELRVIINTKE